MIERNTVTVTLFGSEHMATHTMIVLRMRNSFKMDSKYSDCTTAHQHSCFNRYDMILVKYEQLLGMLENLFVYTQHPLNVIKFLAKMRSVSCQGSR